MLTVLLLLVLTFSLTASFARGLTLEDGLVLYLDMNDGVGSTVTDKSVYGNSGTVYGASWVDGKYGKALRFDGSDDYVAVSYASSLNPAKITVCAWVKLYQNITHHIVRIDNYGSYWFGVDNNGKVFFGYREASGGSYDTVFSTDAITWGEWTFIFGGMSPEGESDAKRFVGFDDNYYEFSAWESRWIGSGVVGIGMWNNEFTQGVIDEVRIYNRALSPAEIRELYAYSPYEVAPQFYENKQLYLTATVDTVNNVNGYLISETAPSSVASVSANTEGSNTITWGWRFYLRYEDSATELTSGEPTATVSRSSTGAGLQTTYYTMQDTRLRFGFTAFEAVLYYRVNSGSWVPAAVFVTDNLFYTRFIDETWTVQLYTDMQKDESTTNCTVYWGNSTALSGFGNVIFMSPADYDWQNYYLQKGKPLDFLNFGLTARTGNMIYAVILCAVCVTLYVRYRNTGMILLLLVLFGGAVGIFNLLIGDALLGIVWLLASFMLAALFWKVFR